MGVFERFFRNRKPATHSHPNPETIQDTIDVLAEFGEDLQGKKTKSVIAHLVECPDCARVACGFWNQTRGGQQNTAA